MDPGREAVPERDRLRRGLGRADGGGVRGPGAARRGAVRTAGRPMEPPRRADHRQRGPAAQRAGGRPQPERGDLHRRRNGARGLLRDVQRDDGRHRVRHGAHRDREQRPVRTDDRPGSGGGERRAGGQLAGRRLAGRAVVGPGNLLPLPAVHVAVDPRPAALRRADAAPDDRAHPDPGADRGDLPHDRRSRAAAAGGRTGRADRADQPGDLRVRTAVAGRPVGGAGGLRTVLGRPGLHARLRWTAGRTPADGPAAGTGRAGRGHGAGLGRPDR